jgi:hypothetical protein
MSAMCGSIWGIGDESSLLRAVPAGNLSVVLVK